MKLLGNHPEFYMKNSKNILLIGIVDISLLVSPSGRQLAFVVSSRRNSQLDNSSGVCIRVAWINCIFQTFLEEEPELQTAALPDKGQAVQGKRASAKTLRWIIQADIDRKLSAPAQSFLLEPAQPAATFPKSLGPALLLHPPDVPWQQPGRDRGTPLLLHTSTNRCVIQQGSSGCWRRFINSFFRRPFISKIKKKKKKTFW